MMESAMAEFFQPTMQAAKALLKQSDLPTADLAESDMGNFLAIGRDEALSGIIGLELHHPYGLLRSLAVGANAQGRGVGKRLVAAIEQLAIANHLKAMYLLTTTAELYFLSLGYSAVSRDKVPPQIQQTAEFSSLCPGDAVVMLKSL